MKRYFSYINILVLPADLCNMNCVYCFHKDFHTSKAFMDLGTLENLMKITLPYYERVSFIWHGGEPLAMGLDFYKEVIRLQNKYKQDKARITNRMQTNLTLLDRETAEYLVVNGFGIGSSFDGVQNDETRGNSEEILAGRDLLLGCGGKCGVISVVSGINVNTLIESYEFCKARGLDYTLNMYIKTENREGSDTFGNVNELIDIGQAFEAEGFRMLLTKAIERRNKCKDCRIYSFCSGECNNIALHTNGIENNGGLFCDSLVKIYSYIEAKVNQVDAEQYPRLNPFVQRIFKKYRPDIASLSGSKV